MIALSNRISSSIKYSFYLIFFLIFLLELFFQIAFIFNLKTFKKTILFFNPFCDQVYWDLEGNSLFNEDKYLYNSTLTIIKKENFKFFNKEKNNNNISQDNELIFYGSSFLDHEYFIPYYKDNLNFAIKSYGFDQIFKSYMMTKNYFPNKNIVIGFLLEDIDRAIFVKRDFPKLKYKRINDKYELTNVPISFELKHNKKIHFYSLKFFRNLIFLLTNDFNYNNHQCKVGEKKLFLNMH